MPSTSARDRIVGRELLEQQVGVAEDRGEQVVEVVRDAAGEPADRFHLLRLPELLFALPERLGASLRSVMSRMTPV